MYSTSDKVFWVKRYATGSSLRQVCDEFVARDSTRPRPSPSTVMQCVRRFDETGNVNEVKKGRRLPPRDNTNELFVLAAVTRDPTANTRTIEKEGGPSQSAAVKILQRHGSRSYHTSTHQELREGDAARRL